MPEHRRWALVPVTSVLNSELPFLSMQHRERVARTCADTKLSAWSEQHHETPPSEAQTVQGHPPEGVLSLQYDMGLCLQSQFGRFCGFFLADSPQRVKLQKRNIPRRTCLPQNLGTKTRWLHFQRPKQMGKEVSQYYKSGLRPLWDWRSTSGMW